MSADDVDWAALVAEGQGSPGTTVIFYIAGDNGSIPEGSMNGTSNEMTYVNGVAESVADQLVWVNTHERRGVGKRNVTKVVDLRHPFWLRRALRGSHGECRRRPQLVAHPLDDLATAHEAFRISPRLGRLTRTEVGARDDKH